MHVDYTCALYIWLQGDRTCQSMKLSKLGDSDGQGRLACCNLLGGAKSWTWLTDWITKTIIYIYMGFPCGALIKNLPANTGDAASIPGSGKAFEVGNGNPLHYSCLENSMHRGAWWATVHGSQRVGQDWAQPHAHFIYIYIYIYIYISFRTHCLLAKVDTAQGMMASTLILYNGSMCLMNYKCVLLLF